MPMKPMHPVLQVGPPTAAGTQEPTQTRRRLHTDLSALEDSGAAARPAEGAGLNDAGLGLGARRSLAGVPAGDAVFVLFTFDFSDVGARTTH